jgi:hypothetical protein
MAARCESNAAVADPAPDGEGEELGEADEVAEGLAEDEAFAELPGGCEPKPSV